MKILIINGPNLNLLGQREPEIYGRQTLDELSMELKLFSETISEVELEFIQTNHEGEILDIIGKAVKNNIEGIVINPAAFTHTSIAIHDALKGCGIPAIEVHLSNISARESFRHNSVTAPACLGTISGLGCCGYKYAISYLKDYIKRT